MYKMNDLEGKSSEHFTQDTKEKVAIEVQVKAEYKSGERINELSVDDF